MKKPEFMAELDLLEMAYPSAFNFVGGERKTAVAAIWYDHFQHIPKELFARASKWCREHERFLSIASLRASIVEVADIPSAYETRRNLENLYEEAPGHPIARRIYNTLGLNYVDAEMTDFAFEREYVRAREWWVEKIMKPENVELLTAKGWPQIEPPKAG